MVQGDKMKELIMVANLMPMRNMLELLRKDADEMDIALASNDEETILKAKFSLSTSCTMIVSKIMTEGQPIEDVLKQYSEFNKNNDKP
jgi:hypothetical protein